MAQQQQDVRAVFLGIVHNDDFIRRALVHMINHRVQDFQDPLTSTLVLMATAPLQLVLCESGLLLFKTNLLPVMQYGLLTGQERTDLGRIVETMAQEQLHETVECSGQYTLAVLPVASHYGGNAAPFHLCKQQLLLNFVDAMMLADGEAQPSRDPTVCGTLCSIVLQRFWSRVCTSSEIVSAVMARLAERMPAVGSSDPIKSA